MCHCLQVFLAKGGSLAEKELPGTWRSKLSESCTEVMGRESVRALPGTPNQHTWPLKKRLLFHLSAPRFKRGVLVE